MFSSGFSRLVNDSTCTDLGRIDARSLRSVGRGAASPTRKNGFAIESAPASGGLLYVTETRLPET